MNHHTSSSKSSNIVEIKVSPVYKKKSLMFTPNEVSFNYINENDNQEIIAILSGRSKSGHAKTLVNKTKNYKLKSVKDKIGKTHSLNYKKQNDIDNYEKEKETKNSPLTEENFNAIITSINELCGRVKKERKKTSDIQNKNIQNPNFNIKNLINTNERINKKTKSINYHNDVKLNKFISKNTNLSHIQINEDEVRSLSNMEDITNFYTYTERCFEMMIEIEKIKNINKCKPCDFPFDNEINKGNKKLAIFDLDETLVHCRSKNINECQYQIEVMLPSRKKGKIGVNIRPNWEKALNIIKDKYIIVVFTASHSAYADAVLNFMDPNNNYFQYRLYRNNCTSVKYEGKEIYIKDLSVFKNIDLKNIIIIDNSVVSFTYQLDNGMPILPYYDSNRDNELVCLAYYLLAIFEYKDLREANKLYVKLDHYKEAAIEKFKIEEEEEEEDEYSDVLSFKNNKNHLLNNIKRDDNNNNNNENNSSKKVIHFEEEITYRKKEDVMHFTNELKKSILGLKKLIPEQKDE